MPVIAVLAQKRMKLSEVLNLAVGSIIQLDKPADDLLELMVNNQRIGRGETVRAGENFGVQVAELGTIQDTILKLGPEAFGPPPSAEPASEPQPAEPAPDQTPPADPQNP
jgi:flagellar motor switch protein FliN